ncbi:hypothetical protein UFOVP257_416 [uncultured Caudovirales phage]|uniref:Uncharacterized protein n=1 Tax=uncultured Caudovirales phage TaxID=2100421 RepID=A0A6J5LGI1_9CAUD|nr:hypothetical protein UFOVP257_416 [uncultured Caudovirales phage]
MKTVYICGDSFGTSDPDYPNMSWSDKLIELIDYKFKVVNLSMVAASNLLISLQADRAIKNNASYIICMGTASTRIEIKIDDLDDDLLSRFFSFSSANPYSLMSCSFLTIENYPLTKDDKKLILDYQKRFFDIDLSIYENKCIIENTLQKLVDSEIPFIFDQGGFEHPMYGGGTKIYFEKYQNNISDINAWDYVKTREFRPYFHITDESVNNSIANYYYDKIVSAIG